MALISSFFPWLWKGNIFTHSQDWPRRPAQSWFADNNIANNTLPQFLMYLKNTLNFQKLGTKLGCSKDYNIWKKAKLNYTARLLKA